MGSQIKAVVFDIGGVLEHTPSTGWPARWEARLGLAPGELETHTAHVWEAGNVGQITLDQVHESLTSLLRLTDGELAAMMADLWAEYLGTANAELIQYASSLRPRFRTGILSNSFVGAREREQAAYGFEGLVDEIVYSHEAGLSKPDPRVYRLACERLDVTPEETVFLDDAEMCVEGAMACGMHAVLYRDNLQAITDLDRLLGR